MAKATKRTAKSSKRIHTGKMVLAAHVILGTLVACGGESADATLTVGDGEGEGLRVVAVEPGEAGASEAPTAPEPIDPATLPVSLQPTVTWDSSVTYGDAERVFNAGDYGVAADMFEAYAERMPTNPWGHYMAGISSWRAGNHERAEAALRRTLEVEPTHGKGMINLTRVLLEQGRASDALDYALRVVELDPYGSEGWRVLGNAHAELGMDHEAAQDYRQAITIDPEDAWTMNNLGLLHIRQGDYQAALGPLARAAELSPGMATFQNNLGAVLERLGYAAQAADAFRMALATEPEHPKASVSLPRIEALLPTTKPEMIEVSDLAAAFAAEVQQWRQDARLAGGEQPR